MSDQDNQSHKPSTEYAKKMLEWQTLKKTIKSVGKDITALKTREKELKTFLSGYMKSNKFDKCNCRDGSTATLTKRMSKGTLTEKVIKTGLLDYFKDNQEEADTCFEVLNSHRIAKETTSLAYKEPKKA